jgi:LSD1 subclass zinc finger protein
MGNRACPLCFSRVPVSLVLTCGGDLVCPSCRAPLELSRASRVLGAICGLIAGILTSRLMSTSSLPGKWALQVVAAVMAYVVGSTVALYFFSDLVVQPNPPAAQFPHPQK